MHREALHAAQNDVFCELHAEGPEPAQEHAADALLGDCVDAHAADVSRPPVLDFFVVEVELLLLILLLLLKSAAVPVVIVADVYVIELLHGVLVVLGGCGNSAALVVSLGICGLFGFFASGGVGELLCIAREVLGRRRAELVELLLKLLDDVLEHGGVDELLRELGAPVLVVPLHEVGVVGGFFLRELDPCLDLLEDFVLLEEEVPPDDGLEAFWRVADLFDHGELDVTVPHDVRVAFVALFTCFRALLRLAARLVEVHQVAHDYRLD